MTRRRPDVPADEGFRLDRAADRLQRRDVSDHDPCIDLTKASFGRDEDDQLRPVPRESQSQGEPVDRRLGQLRTGSDIEETKQVVAPDRKGSPVGAIRQAPPFSEVSDGQWVSDLLVGPGIEEEDVATGGHRQGPSGRTGSDPPQCAAVTVHDPDRCRAAPKGGEQVAAGLRRVLDRDRLTCEQQREVQTLLDLRLGAEALGELTRFRVSSFTALDHGQDPR